MWPGEPDHYAVLGVPRDATGTDIRRAYLKQVLEHHPDRAKTRGGQGDRLARDVITAYDSLKDPVRRREYDERMSDAARCDERKDDAPVSSVTDVELDELAAAEGPDGTELFSMPCRCGLNFVLSAFDLEQGLGGTRPDGQASQGCTVVQCSGCTAKIRVHYGAVV